MISRAGVPVQAHLQGAAAVPNCLHHLGGNLQAVHDHHPEDVSMPN